MRISTSGITGEAGLTPKSDSKDGIVSVAPVFEDVSSLSARAADPDTCATVAAVVGTGPPLPTRRTNNTWEPFSGSGVKRLPFQLPRRLSLRRLRMPAPP